MSNEHHGFACPQEVLDADYLLAITRSHGARNAELFLDRFRPHLAASGEGMERVLEEFRDDPGDFETAWHSSVGQLEVVIGQEWALIAAVNLALHLGERRSGSWNAVLSRPCVFRFAHFQLPLASRISFARTHHEASIQLEHDGSVTRSTFLLEDGEWQSNFAERLYRVPTTGGSVLILPALPAPVSLPEGLVASAPPDEATQLGYASAYALVDEFAATYAPWIRRTIQALVPLESPPNATCSNSFEFLPGIVALSREAPSISLAELLVHEASHQYFHILSHAGPVVDGSDTRLYYSPARRMHRPIDRILLAYHAFANILLFYRTCLKNGFASATDNPTVCSDQEQFLGPWLDELSEPLRSTSSLTPLGRALFEPLATHLESTAPS